MTDAKVIRVHWAPDSDNGRLSAIDIRTHISAEYETARFPCGTLVISGSCWSADVLSSLFPSVSLGLRMAKQQPVQTWLRFSKHFNDGPRMDEITENLETSLDSPLTAQRQPQWTSWLWWTWRSAFNKPSSERDRLDCDQAWLSSHDHNPDLHISLFTDGELYAAGAIELGDKSPPCPSSSSPHQRT